MKDSAQETIKRIEQQLDEALIQRLVLHAARKMERCYWQGVLDGGAPGGIISMDFVDQAIEKTIKGAQGIRDVNGYRNWDYTAQPDLYVHLKSVIDSDINHLAESWENKHFRSETALRRTGDDGEEIEALPQIPTSNVSPDDACAEAELEQARVKILFDFFDFLADDRQLQKVTELLIDGVKQSELATRLSITPKQMYVVTRRLERRAAEFRKKKANTIHEAKTNA